MSRGEHPSTVSFQTVDLIQAAFLWSKGHEPTQTTWQGHYATFSFATLAHAEAVSLLTGPDFQLCRRYSHAWRALRRMADEAVRNGGRR